jgi:pyruvate kinase
MALMRDVYPIDFDSRGLAASAAARSAAKRLFDMGFLEEGDRLIFTSGDTMERHGATNTLRLLQIGPDGRAEGLGEL